MLLSLRLTDRHASQGWLFFARLFVQKTYTATITTTITTTITALVDMEVARQAIHTHNYPLPDSVELLKEVPPALAPV